MQDVDRPTDIETLPQPARTRRPRMEAQPLRGVSRSQRLNWIDGQRGRRRDIG